MPPNPVTGCKITPLVDQLDLNAPENAWLVGTEVRMACRVQLPAQNGQEATSIVVGLQDYAFTRAIVVGLREDKTDFYDRRYCYPNRRDADIAFSDWLTAYAVAYVREDPEAFTWFADKHPSGDWVKMKGRYQGQPADELNPALNKDTP